MVYINPKEHQIIKCESCGCIVGYHQKDFYVEKQFDYGSMENIKRIFIKCPYCFKDITLINYNPERYDGDIK